MYKTVYKDDSFKIMIELRDDVALFIHAEVYKWSHTVAKNMLMWLNQFKRDMKEQGVPVVFTYSKHQDDKWYKFVDLFGFEFLKNIQGLNIYMLRV